MVYLKEGEQMKIDLHTHTLLSGHAYSTVKENIDQAKLIGLEAIGVTDHGPTMPGVPKDPFHVVNMGSAVPDYVEGIRIVHGFEANIIDHMGKIDLPLEYSSSVEYILGSLHNICILPRSKKENTEAIINAMAMGSIDAVAHPDDPTFPLDYEALCDAAVEYKVALEVNNTSLKGNIRKNCRPNTTKMLQIAKEKGAYITVGSDAHFYLGIGEVGLSVDLIKAIDYPTDKIITYSLSQLEAFLKMRKRERTV